MLDSYISKHVNKELRVTVVDLHGNVLFDSSQNDSMNWTTTSNARSAESAERRQGLRPTAHLRNHRQDLFLFCHRLRRCIIRSALPYNVNLMNNLAADPHYIWFTVIVSLLLISVFYKFTSKLGSASTTCASLPKEPTRTNL